MLTGQISLTHRRFVGRALVIGATFVAATAAADRQPIVFRDIAADPARGLSYQRVQSASEAIFDERRAMPVYNLMDIARTPLKSRGAPGVALLDFDRDGDLDIYVTNGPGEPNSLFENRIRPERRLRFRDVAVNLGADLTSHDSTGVCFGDIDNDGDPDLLVLGQGEGHHLLENRRGRFVDITNKAAGGITSEIRGGAGMQATSCSFGDIDADGRLDVVVSNTFADWRQQAAILMEPFAQNQHNELFWNRGDNVFTEVSAAVGLRDLSGLPPGAASITWAIAMVDLDADGDTDILHADDQAAIPYARYGGVDRGFLHHFRNDGTGQFTNVSAATGTQVSGNWMGLTFGDLNCDRRLDFFGSNLGDYMLTMMPLTYNRGDSSSRWFLQQANGTFTDPGVGSLVTTPFGWGNAMFDYDNDGDLDIVFYGGLEPGPFLENSNPGTLLRNEGCSANFTWDRPAIPYDHGLRIVEGLAVGDLDLDGFDDIVSVSGGNAPPGAPTLGYEATYGSEFDAPSARIVPTFRPIGGLNFVWNGLKPVDGNLVVELNSASNGNRSVSVELIGTAGLVDGGRVNRSGIGALVTVTPRRGRPVTRPVMGGASYASQDALVLTYGLGRESRATVEVVWPGGTVNRIYDVRHGERLRIPEIPCDCSRSWPTTKAYYTCVENALETLKDSGVITAEESARLGASAQRAFEEH
ncbi:MAG: CRTAC1 family protein [Thermoanaerobaculia bacterium]|nr:CRTAC1 family protein [Thermoanaerobaculia bacterium]